MASTSSSSKITGLPGAIFVFLFMSAMAIACLVGALVLGVEAKMDIVRTGERTFSITAENSFAGFTFHRDAIQGVGSVTVGDAYRDRTGDSEQERRRQRERQHLVFKGDDDKRLLWDKEDHYVLVDAFMRGTDPSLALRDPVPGWRKAASWAAAGFGFLVFLGGVGAFFPKRKAAPPHG